MAKDENYFNKLKPLTGNHKLLQTKSSQLSQRIKSLKDEVKKLEIEYKANEDEEGTLQIEILNQINEILLTKEEIQQKAQANLELKKRKELWMDIFTRLNDNIPILLSRLAELLNINEKELEKILKKFVESDSSRGRYLELEKIFVKGKGLKNSLDQLIKLVP